MNISAVLDRDWPSSNHSGVTFAIAAIVTAAIVGAFQASIRRDLSQKWISVLPSTYTAWLFLTKRFDFLQERFQNTRKNAFRFNVLQV